MPPESARRVALAALAEWRRGQRFADVILQERLAGNSLGGSDRGFALELFYGILRNLSLLDFWIAQLRPDSLDPDSQDLLRLGFYQVFILRTPTHAAVFETVALAGGKNRGLINGILRSALRRFDELEANAAKQPSAIRFSHPPFLVERWTEQFGAEAALALCAWNNQPAPLYARVNRLRNSVTDFSARHPEAEGLPERENFLRLATLPNESVARGQCYLQDPSTAIACELLAPQPGESVLDACAAPGGKSGFLAELMQNRGTLSACDRDPGRAATLRQNLENLGATCARAVVQDWRTGTELPRNSFDRILVDAPCSNTGVMRRRVDVRWRLRAEDFVRMPNEQLSILRTVIPLLKSGGVLVYSTCSLEREENEAVVGALLETAPFLKLTAQKSVLPFRDQFDGAFAARLERVP
ncbi:MAG: 16S rRNA (cytosine(967)-C(5))-methyltransferase RsmB [Chthoniobacterales bacterium]